MASLSVDVQAKKLLERVYQEIPLTAAMQLSLQRYDGNQLILKAPLTPNINDKQTAFAGSITALANITGWSLLTLWSAESFGQCRVAIAEAKFLFHQPITTDFTASVVLPDTQTLAALRQKLSEKGRCKVSLTVVIADQKGEAAQLEALYAIWKDSPAS